MLVYYDTNKKIIAFNIIISEEESQEYITEGISKWINDSYKPITDISYGKHCVMYLNDDDTIRYEIEDIPAAQASESDILKQQLLDMAIESL